MVTNVVPTAGPPFHIGADFVRNHHYTKYTKLEG